MLLQVLFCLFLNPLASAKDYSALEPLWEVKPAATSGDMKAEYNCLSQYQHNYENIQGVSYTGTHDGKTGFYILTNKTIHFHPVDKETHNACFVKAESFTSADTSDQSSNTQERNMNRSKKRTDSQKGPKNPPKEQAEKGQSEVPPKEDAMGGMMGGSLQDFNKYTDRFFFNIKGSDESPYYVVYTQTPQSNQIPDMNIEAYGSYALTTETVMSTMTAPRNNQPTCSLTDHQALDEESKVDLENLLVEKIQNTYKIFESMANLNAGRSPYGSPYGFGGYNNYGDVYPNDSADEPQDKYTYTPKDKSKLLENYPKGLNDSEGRVIHQAKKAKIMLPNPQNYINRLESCRGVKSERVARALEREIAKFKIQDASSTKPTGSKRLDK